MAEAAVRMSQAHSAGARLTIDNLDDLGRALLMLATEVSVLNDRQRVLEAVLEARGIDVRDAVRDYQPSGELAETLAEERSRLARAIVETLCPPTS